MIFASILPFKLPVAIGSLPQGIAPFEDLLAASQQTQIIASWEATDLLWTGSLYKWGALRGRCIFGLQVVAQGTSSFTSSYFVAGLLHSDSLSWWKFMFAIHECRKSVFEKHHFDVHNVSITSTWSLEWNMWLSMVCHPSELWHCNNS